MEEYPEEMRSPPVSLVSVVGCSELHSFISTHLHSLDPPINTLALPDLSKVSLLLPPPKPNPADFSAAAAPPPAGILKRDWLLKHRTKVPAVVAALISSDRVSGDPAQWLELCSEIDNLKGLIRGRSIKLVVVVVNSHSTEEISEDQMVAVRKRAEVDAKYLLTFYTGEDSQLKQSLHRLGTVFAELAGMYYRDEGRRIKLRIERKSSGPTDLNIRYSFKVAVYAEFRRDWVEALRFYEDAYHMLREVIPGVSTRLSAIQRLVEIKTVAEQLHFKISTLLLHGGKIMEAVIWFRQHNASYRKLKGSPEAIFLHWEWMSRQFLVFAELLETSSAAIQSISHLTAGTADRPLTEWEFQPAHYYQLAAHYLKEKRSSLDFAVSMSEGDIDYSAESVAPSSHMGQFARLIEQGDAFVMQPLTDEEYMRYAISEGKRFQDSFEIIALLKKSCESYTNLKVRRMASFCGFQMAREYYAAGDFNNAKLLFDDIASLYRQEGWVTLLWEVLGYLREGSRKHSKVKEFIEYSFEMAALPISADTGIQSFRFEESGPAGPATLQQRETIHKEVFGLVSEKLGLASTENGDDVKVSSTNPLHLEIDLVSPLRLVLLASVAFHEQIIKPGSSTLVTLSLLSQLPLNFEIDQLEVQFNQSHCNFVIMDAQKPLVASSTDGQSGHRRETAPSLRLSTNKWLRLTYDIKSDQSGKLECISIIAKMGPHFTICCRAESPASMDDLPLWKFEDRVVTYPTKDPALAFFGQRAIQVEEPDPEVDLTLGASGPALIGESFIVPVTVTSKGHEVNSGELKINLVDVRGGGLFSPRDAELSADSHHVELLGISGSEGEDESQLDTDEIKKIQKSFGLVSVPNLKSGDSWSCKLEIKWYRPKPVMLYVSLGYSPDNNGSNTQKVNVHKSLQIEGKNAISISHRLMLPFRRYPLLLSRTKSVPDSDQSVSMPLNETSVLIVSATNCSEVPLQLLSLSIERDNDDTERSCSLHGGEDLLNPALLVPGEKFKKVYTVTSEMNSSKLILGNVCLRWRRNSGTREQAGSAAPVMTNHKLPDVNLESSPLVVSLECPPYAILGDPFTYFVKIQNQTELLQEAKIFLADAQSFVISGSHSDTVYILPKSEHIISYKLVPLSSGEQQLPRFTLTAVRYSTGFQPSIAASTIFVFPSQPHFKMVAVGDDRKESVVAE
ncbi:putative Foie gras liver health family 1 [Rosa chinensis]|uniref:Putative Foie gras liver health family 1 n=1 Tax=Rosa chinensis TaxID=74649 RepID=A0A2P6RL62_ROSCH|nr:trafficking protein particle complex subunit 11 [Rosa chinensis]XP_024180039.1 trafficking protein particle complex subunit 11 [Rosa chinensis]PRQ47168.1 putative Foie gras liver health family 1 [Rosa chinensis]